MEERETTSVDRSRDMVEHERAGEASLRQLADNVREVFWVRDFKTHAIEYLNPAYEHVWGRPREELIDGSITLLDTVHPLDRERVAQALEAEYQGDLFDEEFRILRPDGTTRWVRSRAYPILDGNGQFYRIAGVATDITERKLSEERIRSSLAEKDALIRELYHRTKNNMQVICAMLAIQAHHTQAEQITQVFQALENRIHSMALVHQKLYQSQNLASIDLRDYVEELAGLLLRSYKIAGERVTLRLEADPLPVTIDTAVPCGLILNELISNALKHAFPGGREGQITIHLGRSPEGLVELRVTDNGVGLPPDFDFATMSRMGLQSVFALGERQLQGEVTFESRDGTTCRVRFGDAYYQDRQAGQEES